MAIIIVDVEATCSDVKDRCFANEIIEIGAVRFNLKTLEIEDEFQAFIKPKINKTLTEFCKQLTTITQEQIDSAHDYVTEYNRFVKWFGSEDKNLFASWGYYDQMAFRRDCALHGLEYKLGKNHWNIKRFYEEMYGVAGKNGVGLHKAIRQQGLEFQGVQHRAIADSKNTAYVLRELLKK